MDILDQEATEDESLLSRQPHLAQTRQPSHHANQSLIAMSNQYESTIKQAGSSDGTVRLKWNEWKGRIEILAGGEVCPLHQPASTSDIKLESVLIQ
jgi:programmed cell death 6-interacting protein